MLFQKNREDTPRSIECYPEKKGTTVVHLPGEEWNFLLHQDFSFSQVCAAFFPLSSFS